MRILFATDGSDAAAVARDQLLRMPLPRECEITVLHVIPSDELDDLVSAGEGAESEAADAVREELLDAGKSMTEKEAALIAERGRQTEAVVRAGDPAAQIIGTAEARAIDLTVVGATGQHEPPHILLGSVAKKVLDHAPCSVLVGRGAPPEEELPYRILIGYDGSPASRYAVRMISEWPLSASVEVTIVGVLTVATTLFRLDLSERLTRSWQARRHRLERELAKAVESIESTKASAESRIIDGGTRAGDELLEATRLLASDLSVVGHVGSGALQRLLLGSVAWDVSQYAPCSVLVARK